MYESNASLQHCQQKYPTGCHALYEGGEKNLYKCGKEISYLWELKRREVRRKVEGGERVEYRDVLISRGT